VRLATRLAATCPRGTASCSGRYTILDFNRVRRAGEESAVFFLQLFGNRE
jgi:hypothetical protein